MHDKNALQTQVTKRPQTRPLDELHHKAILVSALL